MFHLSLTARGLLDVLMMFSHRFSLFVDTNKKICKQLNQIKRKIKKSNGMLSWDSECAPRINSQSK